MGGVFLLGVKDIIPVALGAIAYYLYLPFKISAQNGVTILTAQISVRIYHLNSIPNALIISSNLLFASAISSRNLSLGVILARLLCSDIVLFHFGGYDTLTPHSSKSGLSNL